MLPRISIAASTDVREAQLAAAVAVVLEQPPHELLNLFEDVLGEGFEAGVYAPKPATDDHTQGARRGAFPPISWRRRPRSQIPTFPEREGEDVQKVQQPDATIDLRPEPSGIGDTLPSLEFVPEREDDVGQGHADIEVVAVVTRTGGHPSRLVPTRSPMMQAPSLLLTK